MWNNVQAQIVFRGSDKLPEQPILIVIREFFRFQEHISDVF